MHKTLITPALLGLSLLATAQLARAGSQPAMFRGNPQHTGVYDAQGKFPVQKERWRYKTGHLNRSSPAVADGVVYAGSHDGNLYALDAQSGNLKWKFQTPGEITSSPAVADGTVYVNTDAGFFAVDATTGNQKWMLKTGEPVPFDHRWDFFQSSPAWQDGVLYFGSADSYIYAVESKSGNVLWKYKTEGRVRSSPALAGGVVYCGGMDGNLYALDAKAGKLQWKFKTAGNAIFPLGEIQSSPAVADGAVFFGSRDGHLYAVDIATGQRKWAYSHDGSWCISAPAVWDGLVFAGSSDGQFVNALDVQTGTEKWRFKMPSRVFSSAAVAAGQVYFGAWGGEVFWFDAKTGKQSGGAMAENGVHSSPVVAEGVLYFGSDDGYLYAIELEAPRKLVSIKLDPKVYDLYAGEYALPPDFKMTVSREADKLMAQVPGQPKAELLPQSETLFYLGEMPVQIEVVKDEIGRCRQFVLRQSGFEFTLKKTP